MPLVTVAAFVFSFLALFAALYIVFFAIIGPSRVARAPIAKEPVTRFLVVVPAHNEEDGIVSTLISISRLEYPRELVRAIVIADNCTDRTADVVRTHHVECWVRHDLEARGKGQALRWALDQAATQGLDFDALVVVDADGVMESKILQHFDAALQNGAQAAQARNTFELLDQHWFSLFTYATKIAEADLFWAPRRRLGLTSFILGHGFCVRREVLERVPWTAYSIVEDVQYSLELALQDVKIVFISEAQVLSRPTKTVAAAYPQRLRYASGTFQLMAHYAPRLLVRGVFGLRLSALDAFLALILTSRVFILYLTFAALLSSLLAMGVSLAPLAITAAVVALQTVYLVLVVRCGPSQGSIWRGVFYSPIYLGWLIWIQATAAVGRRRKEWVKTSR